MFKPFQKEKNNYTLYGALFGLLFPLGATIIESIHAQGSLSWANVVLVQKENVLLWIIDSAPFWLGLFARLGGVRQDMVLEQKRVEVRDFASFPNENPFPVMRISWDGKMLFSNPFGLEFLKKWNRGLGDLVPDPFLNPLRKIQAGQSSAMVELRNGAGYLLFNLVGIPEMQYINIYSSDITDRKKMEMDLVLAKENAEKANRAKTDFLARMSHELRTPMNAILGFTQLLQMDHSSKLSPHQLENLERIYSAGQHLLELINEVLDLSKVESGKMELSIQPVDINLIIESVITISRPLAEELNVNLEYEILPDELCLVMADPLLLKQVLLYLVSNAVKYNKKNGKVKVSASLLGNDKICVDVQDTGNGIPENLRAELFKPFSRLDPNSDHIEGTGIGLAISKQLIELMGGSLEYEDLRTGGSRFYFDLSLSNNKFLPFQDEESTRSSTP